MPSLTLDILHTAYAGAHAPKRMARDANVSLRTSEKWWAGLTTPRADVLLRLAQSTQHMRAELMRRLGEHGYGNTAESNDGVGSALGVGAAGQAGGLDRSAAASGASNAARVVRGRGR